MVYRSLIASALMIPLACSAAELDPKVLAFQKLDDVKWTSPMNAPPYSSIISGDPEKPGLYVQLVKWPAGNNMSRPHFHANARYITVLRGTWWVGTGRKFQPDQTEPMRAGTVVTHYGKQVHYDGSKDEDAIILIVGEGPATATPAEDK